MNKNSLNIILCIALIVVIVGVFLKLLPYLLICGVVIWGTVKIYKFFSGKPTETNNRKGSDDNYEYNIEDNTDDVNEVIDVDYKDV